MSAVALGALAVLPGTALAAPGDPDPSFGVGGTKLMAGTERPVDLLAQPDGRLVVVGADQSGDFVIRRLLPDGSADRSFGGDGTSSADFGEHDQAASAALHPDGRIVVAGVTNPSRRTAVVRFDPDGSLDATFAAGTGKLLFDESLADGVVALPDGAVALAGTATAGGSDLTFLRLTPDGRPDGTVFTRADFGGNSDSARAAVASPDGTLLIAGHSIDDDPAVGTTAVARYLPDGRLDPAFDGDGKAVVDSIELAQALHVQPDGKILVAGTSSDEDPMLAVARLDRDGTPDLAFGSGGTARVGLEGRDVLTGSALAPDGTIILSGTSEGDYTLGVARFGPDGTLDRSFGSGGISTVDIDGFTLSGAGALQPDGKFVAAGVTVFDGAINRPFATRLLTAADPPPAPPAPPGPSRDPGGPAPAPGPASPGRDRTAPALSALRVARIAGARIEVRFALTEAARVRLSLQRRVRGRFRATIGGFAIAGRRGANRVRVDDRRLFRRLRPGRYRWVVRAVDASGNAGRPRHVGITVRARSRGRR